MCRSRSLLTKTEAGPDIQNVLGCDCQTNREEDVGEVWIQIQKYLWPERFVGVYSTVGSNTELYLK